MRVLQLKKANHLAVIKTAVKVLSQGGLVIYPTETCYGAGVDAINQEAVNKLLSYKTRREGKPLSIAVADKLMAQKYVHLNATAENLYQKFLPGPLTVVSHSRGLLAEGVESETSSLGIRIPDYPLIIKIVKKLNKPITATSANVSYKPKPYSTQKLLSQISKKQQSLIDLIIDAGTLPQRPASTVVDTSLDDPLVLRQGQLLQKAAKKSVVTKSPQETTNLAKTLMLKNWNSLQKRPLMLMLIGDLGAGKTQFAKGVGQFLGLKQTVTSPTYTIEKEYDYNRHKIKGKFLHLDTWRLQNIAELNQLKLQTRLQPKTVMAIEWASRTLKPLLQLAKKSNAKVVSVKLKQVKNRSNRRQITIKALGK